MAFPVVAAVNGGNNTTEGKNHTVNLPANISAGDLLLVIFGTDFFPNEDISFPEGWTSLFEVNNDPSAPAFRMGAWYRVADGTEGATITVTTVTNQMTAHTSYRITGYSGVPECGTAAVATSGTAPNPPSLTPSWGALDTLWFAIEGNDDVDTVTAYPTDYTNGRADFANATGGCNVGSAYRELNAVSENPDAFTIAASEQWIANTIAVQPAAPAGWANIKNIRAGTGTILATDLGSIWYGTSQVAVADIAEIPVGVAV